MADILQDLMKEVAAVSADVPDPFNAATKLDSVSRYMKMIDSFDDSKKQQQAASAKLAQDKFLLESEKGIYTIQKSMDEAKRKSFDDLSVRNIVADWTGYADQVAKNLGHDSYEAAPKNIRAKIYDDAKATVGMLKSPGYDGMFNTIADPRLVKAKDDDGLMRKLVADSIVSGGAGVVSGAGETAGLLAVGANAALGEGWFTNTLRGAAKAGKEAGEAIKEAGLSKGTLEFNKKLSALQEKGDAASAVEAGKLILSNPALVPQALAGIAGSMVPDLALVGGAAAAVGKTVAGGAALAGKSAWAADVIATVTRGIGSFEKTGVGSAAASATRYANGVAVGALTSGLSAGKGAVSDTEERVLSLLKDKGINPESAEGKRILDGAREEAAVAGIGVGLVTGAILPGAEKIGADLLTKGGRIALTEKFASGGVVGTLKSAAGQAGKRGIGEGVQEGAESVIPGFVTDTVNEKEFGGAKAEARVNLVQAVMGGIYGGASGGSRAVTGKLLSLKKDKQAADNVDQSTPDTIDGVFQPNTPERAAYDGLNAKVSTVFESPEIQSLIQQEISDLKKGNAGAKSAAAKINALVTAELNQPENGALFKDVIGEQGKAVATQIASEIDSRINQTVLLSDRQFGIELTKIAQTKDITVNDLDGGEVKIKVTPTLLDQAVRDVIGKYGDGDVAAFSRKVKTEGFARGVVGEINDRITELATNQVSERAQMTPEQKAEFNVAESKDLFAQEIEAQFKSMSIDGKGIAERYKFMSAELGKLNNAAVRGGELSAKDEGKRQALNEALSKRSGSAGDIDTATLKALTNELNRDFTNARRSSQAQIDNVISLNEELANRQMQEAQAMAVQAQQKNDQEAAAFMANEIESLQKKLGDFAVTREKIAAGDQAGALRTLREIDSIATEQVKAKAMSDTMDMLASVKAIRADGKEGMTKETAQAIVASATARSKELAKNLTPDSIASLEALNKEIVRIKELISPPKPVKTEVAAKPTTEAGKESAAGKPDATPNGQTALFSSGDAPAKPSTDASIRSELDREFGRDTAKDLPNVIITTSAKRADGINIPDDVKAYYDGKTGKITLLSDRIAQGEAVSVALHEIAHKQMTPAEVAKATSMVSAWANAKPDSIERQVHDYAKTQAEKSGNVKEELVPYAVQGAILLEAQPGNKGLVPKFLQYLKNTFTKMVDKVFGRSPQLTVDDLLTMARGAANREFSAVGFSPRDVVLFSQASQDFSGKFAQAINSIKNSVNNSIESTKEMAPKNREEFVVASKAAFRQSKAAFRQMMAGANAAHTFALMPHNFLVDASKFLYGSQEARSGVELLGTLNRSRQNYLDSTMVRVEQKVVDPFRRLEFKQQRELQAFMQNTQFAEFNPLNKSAAPKNADQRAVLDAYKKLTVAQKNIYESAVKINEELAKDRLAILDKTLGERTNINPEAKKALLRLFKEDGIDGYLSIQSSGKYALFVYEEGSKTPIYRSLSDDLSKLKAEEAQLQEQYRGNKKIRVAEPIQSIDQIKQLDGASQQFIESTIKEFSSILEGNPDLKDSITNALMVKFIKGNARKTGFSRKLVDTSQLDMVGNLARGARAQAYQVGSLRTKPQEAKALAAIEADVKSGNLAKGVDGITASQALNALKAHAAPSQPESKSFSSVANAFTNFMFMGFSVAAATINLTQTTNQTLPRLAGLAARYNDSSRQFNRILLDAGRAMAGLPKSLDEAKTAEQKAIIKLFNDAGLQTEGELTQAIRAANYGVDGASASVLSKAASAANILNEVSERYNRRVAFYSAYQLSKANGLSEQDSRDAANAFVSATQFDGSQGNKPLLVKRYGEPARLVYALKTFAISTYASIWADVSRLMKDKNVPDNEKREIITRLKGQLVMQSLMGGAFSLITPVSLAFTSLLSLGLSAAGVDDDEMEWGLLGVGAQKNEDRVERYIKKTLGEEAARFVTGGVPKVLGVDLRANLQQDLWFRGPIFQDDGLKKAITGSIPLISAADTAFGIASNVVQGKSFNSDIAFGQALTQSGQRGLSAVGRALSAVENDGRIVTKNGTIVTQIDGLGDWLLVFGGMTPTKLSEGRSSVREDAALNKEYQSARAALSQTVGLAVSMAAQGSDKDLTDLAQKAVDKFNEKFKLAGSDSALNLGDLLETAKKRYADERKRYEDGNPVARGEGAKRYIRLKTGRDEQ